MLTQSWFTLLKISSIFIQYVIVSYWRARSRLKIESEEGGQHCVSSFRKPPNNKQHNLSNQYGVSGVSGHGIGPNGKERAWEILLAKQREIRCRTNFGKKKKKKWLGHIAAVIRNLFWGTQISKIFWMFKVSELSISFFIKEKKNVLTMFVSIEQMRNVGVERRGAKGYS